MKAEPWNIWYIAQEQVDYEQPLVNNYTFKSSIDLLTAWVGAHTKTKLSS